MKSLVNLGREACAVAPVGMSPQEWARACKGPLHPCRVELESREEKTRSWGKAG